MDLSRIEKLIEPDRVEDLETLYAEFRASAGTGALDRFLLFLFEKGHIKAGMLTWVGDAEAVSAARAPMERSVHPGGGAGEDAGEAARTRFDVIETIGEGGMGAVALARDRNLHRYVAYKLLHEEKSRQQQSVERFDFEAQVTAQLDHPNIVPVYSHDSGRGYAMKLVAGQPLNEVVQEARGRYRAGQVDEAHSLASLLEVFLKVCDAIHYAHSKGVVHRDLKPHNVLIGRFNEVYVVDWGIAKLLGEPGGKRGAAASAAAGADEGMSAMTQTREGEILGTPGYMSPEQIRGDNDAVGPASDVFCLGLILYEVVNLRAGYASRPLRDLLVKMAKADLRSMTNRRVTGTAAREMEAIINKACALEPAHRYATAEALANDVRRFLRREEVSARRDGPLQRVVRWVGQHREATILILAAIALVGAGGAVWSLHERQQALLAAEAREDRLAALVTSVAQRARSIERQFLAFEAIVEGLSAAAAQLVLRGAPSEDAIYTNRELSAPTGGPADFVQAPAYGKRITLDHLVFKLAPDVDEAAVTPLLRQLTPLRHHFKQTLFESVAGAGWVSREAEIREQILNRGATLTWTYVGLASGIHVAYPGKGGYPAEYDPRKRPWYRHSADGQGTQWLAPYVDVNGRGLVVPTTRPVRAPDGTLLGVAGVEMTLDHIREQLLQVPENGDIRATYLVDERGRVVSSSGDTRREFAVGTLIADLTDLSTYPDDEVVAAIVAQKSGHRLRSEDGHDTVIVYQRLGSIRWYLVAEAVLTNNPAESRL